jgi:hypothetical protein
VLRQRLGERAERRGRHGEIVHVLRVNAELVPYLAQDVKEAARVARVEAAARETQSLRERLPLPVLGRETEFDERLAHTGAEVPMRDIAAAGAHQLPLPRQQVPLSQLEEGRQHHSPGEITAATEQHEDRGRQLRGRRCLGHDHPSGVRKLSGMDPERGARGYRSVRAGQVGQSVPI